MSITRRYNKLDKCLDMVVTLWADLMIDHQIKVPGGYGASSGGNYGGT